MGLRGVVYCFGAGESPHEGLSCGVRSCGWLCVVKPRPCDAVGIVSGAKHRNSGLPAHYSSISVVWLGGEGVSLTRPVRCFAGHARWLSTVVEGRDAWFPQLCDRAQIVPVPVRRVALLLGSVRLNSYPLQCFHCKGV